MRILTITGPLLLTAFTLQACGGSSRPPEPPPYTPVNSPEAESPCPSEWQAAKSAREAMVGETDPGARTAAAAAVYAQAECERDKLNAVAPPRGAQAAVVGEIRLQRIAMQNAGNLYEEVARYHSPGFAEALGRIGELKLAFARFLTSTPAPTDLDDPVERVEFMNQLKLLSESFVREAAQTFEAALEVAAEDPAATNTWSRRMCDELKRLNTIAWERQPLCVTAGPGTGNE